MLNVNSVVKSDITIDKEYFISKISRRQPAFFAVKFILRKLGEKENTKIIKTKYCIGPFHVLEAKMA